MNTTVYVVTLDFGHEGEALLGVYSTEDKAMAAASQPPDAMKCVYAVELDAPFPEGEAAYDAFEPMRDDLVLKRAAARRR